MQETSEHNEVSPQDISPVEENRHLVVESVAAEKKAAWEAKRREIDQITDALGLGIDEGIKETVVTFSMLGLNTSGSCEGHLDHGLTTPWVDIEAPGRPETEFLGEMDVFQRVADRHGIPLEEFRRGVNMDAWWEAMRESSENGQTEEFTAWQKQSDVLGHTLEGYLNDFYQKREIHSDVRLHADNIVEGQWRIWSGTVEEHFFSQTTPQQLETSALLAKRQGEMRAFTGFLREKYFSIPSSNITSGTGTPTPPHEVILRTNPFQW